MNCQPEHNCPCCTCGQIKFSWSDREDRAYPNDHEKIAHIVIACAFDHYYDRGNGVPNGFNPALENRLKVVVADHMNRLDSQWQNYTVYCVDEDPRRIAFYQAIVDELDKANKV
jgi:hypothetical protein